MKKSYLFCLGFLMISQLLQAQGPDVRNENRNESAEAFTIGVRIGLNIASLKYATTSTKFEAINAPVFGIFLTHPLGSRLAIQPEILFSSKGYRWSIVGTNINTEVKLSYIEIPVLLKYIIQWQNPVKPNLYIGPAIGVLKRAKANTIEGTVDVMGGFKKTDFGLVCGGGLDVNAGSGIMIIDVRYTFGLSELWYGISEENSKNRVLSLSVGYGF